MCIHLVAEFAAYEFVLYIYSWVSPHIICLVHYFAECNWYLSCLRVFTVYIWDQCMVKVKPVCKGRSSANQQQRHDKLREKSVKRAATCPGAVKKPRTHRMILHPRTTPLWTMCFIEYLLNIRDGLQSVHVHGLQVWVPSVFVLPKIQVCCRNSKWALLETQCLWTGQKIISMYRCT